MGIQVMFFASGWINLDFIVWSDLFFQEFWNALKFSNLEILNTSLKASALLQLPLFPINAFIANAQIFFFLFNLSWWHNLQSNQLKCCVVSERKLTEFPIKKFVKKIISEYHNIHIERSQREETSRKMFVHVSFCLWVVWVNKIYKKLLFQMEEIGFVVKESHRQNIDIYLHNDITTLIKSFSSFQKCDSIAKVSVSIFFSSRHGKFTTV